jgi:hypothetical protein
VTVPVSVGRDVVTVPVFVGRCDVIIVSVFVGISKFYILCGDLWHDKLCSWGIKCDISETVLITKD